jgi:hypothetical protein
MPRMTALTVSVCVIVIVFADASVPKKGFMRGFRITGSSPTGLTSSTISKRSATSTPGADKAGTLNLLQKFVPRRKEGRLIINESLTNFL